MNMFLAAAVTSIFWIAVFLFFVKLMFELKIIKNKEYVRTFCTNSVKTTAIGLLLIFICFVIYNLVKEKINFFNFEVLFGNDYINKWLDTCKDFNILNSLKSGVFPLYPLLINILGKILFGTYVPTAVFMSFISSCIFINFIYLIIEKNSSKELANKSIMSVLLFPLTIVMFLPVGISMLMAFSAASLYYCKCDKFSRAIVFSILACLTGIQGIAAVMFVVLYIITKKQYYAAYITVAILLGFIPIGSSMYMHNLIFGVYAIFFIKKPYTDIEQSIYAVAASTVTSCLLYMMFAFGIVI